MPVFAKISQSERIQFCGFFLLISIHESIQYFLFHRQLTGTQVVAYEYPGDTTIATKEADNYLDVLDAPIYYVWASFMILCTKTPSIEKLQVCAMLTIGELCNDLKQEPRVELLSEDFNIQCVFSWLCYGIKYCTNSRAAFCKSK